MKRTVLIALLLVAVVGAVAAQAALSDVNGEDITSFSETGVTITTPTTVECKNLGHSHTDPNANPGHDHSPDGGGGGHVHCPDQLPEMGVILDPDDPTLTGLLEGSTTAPQTASSTTTVPSSTTTVPVATTVPSSTTTVPVATTEAPPASTP